jgi:hypothetical protein
MLPISEYADRQESWRARRSHWQKLFIQIGNVRLAIAVAAAVLAWLVFGRDALSAWWLSVPLIAFIALAIWHQRVIRNRTLAERAIRFYDRGLARLRDSWAGTGETGDAYRDAGHVYAEDLDVFGKGSLFELISNARTSSGECTLAQWLLEPASLEEAQGRQQAVRELSSKLDMREDFVLLGEDVRALVDADGLERWGTAPAIKFPAYFRQGALLLSIAGSAALVLKLASVIPLWPLLVLLVCDFAVIFATRQRVASIAGSIETAAHDLSLLSLLIERLEQERFSCASLQALHAAVQTNGLPASKRIKTLQRWMELLDSSDHILMRVAGPLLLWRQQVTAAIEAWCIENGPRVGAWVRALAELEALSSMATLAFEKPQWAFPELVPSTSALFEAKGLRHPLLGASVSVANDVELSPEQRLLIVSGSNMSGKSTLLRAVGLNTVLAWSGAPVAADSLRTSRLRMGASIRVTDSLQDNKSRFFAEISRLRQIVDLSKSGDAVLFLLDELLSGTNSHDRRIGAAGIVRGLLRANSIGLLTTHDLALTQLDAEVAAKMSNVHFEDRISAGGVEFDYRLLPGVVTHSNALELMRSIGLEI